ncbi:hypothetical protein ACLOJK_007466 [Asimina triloba]
MLREDFLFSIRLRRLDNQSYYKFGNHPILEDNNLGYTTRYDPCTCGTNRVDLDKIKAKAKVAALHLQKFSTEATFQRLSSQVELSSEFDAARVERDEAIRRAIVVVEEVVQSLMERVTPRPGAEAFSGADPNAGKGSSLSEEVSIL